MNELEQSFEGMGVSGVSAHFDRDDWKIQRTLTIEYAVAGQNLAERSAPNARSVEVKAPSLCMSRVLSYALSHLEGNDCRERRSMDGSTKTQL